MRRFLMVIDMLNGFLKEGGKLYCGPQGRAIIPFVRDKVKEYVQAGDPVVFLCDAHAPDDAEFNYWPSHCVRGSYEAEIVDELKPLAAGQIIIPKTKYMDFMRPEVENLLEQVKPDVVELLGVCTNICVFFAAVDLRRRGYRVRVYEAGVSSFDEEAHKHALDQMRKVLFVDVVPAPVYV